MDVEQQTKILRETHGLVLFDYLDDSMCYSTPQRMLYVAGPPAFVDGVGTPAYTAWAHYSEDSLDVRLSFPRRPWLGGGDFSDFVAAVIYAKERLAAAEETT